MAIADITAKILQDAEQQAAGIIRDAEQRARQISTAAEGKRTAAVDEVQHQGEQKSAQIKKKIANLTAHRRKEQTLACKREMLSTVYTQAKERLAKLPAAEKEKLYAGMLQQIDVAQGTVAPVKGDEAAVEKALKQSGKSFTLGTPISGEAGFVFTSDAVEMDFRIGAIVDRELGRSLESELFTILFQ